MGSVQIPIDRPTTDRLPEPHAPKFALRCSNGTAFRLQSMSRSTFSRTLIIGAGIVSLAPAVWWISGLIPSDVTADTADYLVHPLRLPFLVEPAIGLLCVLLTGRAARELHRGVRDGEFRSEWWQVAAALGAIAAFGGFTYRIVTAPVIGANIGGGALILFALPLSVGMLTWAGLALHTIRHPNPASESRRRP